VNPIQRIGAALKAFSMTFGSHGRGWSFGWGWGRSRIDYRAEIGDGRSNSIVEACIGWIQRTFPEAPVRVSTVNAQGEEVPQPDHELKMLLDTPNQFYPGELLWSATLADRTADGNAYWLKIRSASGRPVELWWVPHTLIEPRWPQDGSAFISHYEYKPDAVPIRIETADVVHFRWGLDPQNPRKGCSPLKTLLREIFTDDEASNYTAAMLRNVGVPPVVISPGKDAKPTQEELDEVKSTYIAKTTGDRRGEPIVMRGETSVQVLGFNPQQMDMRMARRVPEERVSAVLGIPAAVVGLGSGLENTKVGATMAEMREQAYESNIIPTQRLMGAELRTQLVRDFGDVRRLRLDFDLSQVRVLQADQNDLHQRAREDLTSGGITVNEFREMIELEPLDGDAGDVLFIPTSVTPTHPLDVGLAATPAGTPAPAAQLPASSSAGQPAKVLSLPAGRRAAKASLGDPLNLTQEEIDQASIVTEADLEAARALWQDEAPDDLEELLDAQEAAG
jgi:HK97 family phage portal protein